jgi:hypothetical protein
MKKHKKIARGSAGKRHSMNTKLRMPISLYSQMYRRYLTEEFPTVEMMIRRMVKAAPCREYALRFPLEGLLRGAVKKLMVNALELGVLGLFFEQTATWGVGASVVGSLFESFPDIIHVNEPTDATQLKELSIFLSEEAEEVIPTTEVRGSSEAGECSQHPHLPINVLVGVMKGP